MATQYQAYYTEEKNITHYMASSLGLGDQSLVLEPCGGEGAFIDALLDVCPHCTIDTNDIAATAVSVLTSKYDNNTNVNVRFADTLFDETFDMYAMNGYYDAVIGNPPYGAWQDMDRRKDLKKRYPNMYVKETYSLFLYRCVNMLKDSGRLAFIIPDTFLYLHNHEQLRKFLLTNTVINEILLFPSKFFPGVSFGYSKLCIIILQRTVQSDLALQNEVCIRRNFTTTEEFALPAANEVRVYIRQKDIFDSPSHAFIIDKNTSNIIKSSKEVLGDIASCVTGIYSGDNLSYINKVNDQVRGSKKYRPIDLSLVNWNWNSTRPIEEARHFVPIVKGNSSASYQPNTPQWFIDWSVSAIHHYQSDKKARFQNSEFYFKTGVALPMIKSIKVKATLMQKSVFDQSIVGIFPHEDRDLNLILALLNSDIGNKIIHAINPTANNSANYIKKIPLPNVGITERETIDRLTKKLIEDPNQPDLIKRIENILREGYRW